MPASRKTERPLPQKVDCVIFSARIQLFPALFLVVIFSVYAIEARAADPAHPNDVARFLAGLEPASGSPLSALAREPGWRQHAKEMRSAWRAIDGRQLSNIKSWSRSKLRKRSATMFYMFGGPDFAHADAFYPHASTYVLSGLEPVGRKPPVTTLRGEQLTTALAALRGSFTNFLKFGYFITSEMNAQFKAGRFTGTLPVLYVMLASSGKTIHKVEYVALSGGRAVQVRSGSAVRITYSGRGGGQKTLYYFQTNLADAGVAQSGFLRFCARLGEGDSLVKSASYLLHQGHFSRVRTFLLKNSATIVQDDTGIPFRYFDRSTWSLRPYGQYLGPIETFKHAYQEDLAQFFKSGGARAVRFGIGYRWHPTRTNVLVAERN